MVEIVILFIIFMIASRAAKYRGRKGPIYGFIALMAYCLTIILLFFITEDVHHQPSTEEFSINLVLVNEYYRKIFICALGASFLVVVVVLLIPRPAAYAGRPPTSSIPYRLIGSIIGLGGIGILYYNYHGGNGRLIYTIWAFIMLGLANEFWNLSRQQRTVTGQGALSDDGRAPVLFLRSFSTESHPAKTLSHSAISFWKKRSLTLGEILKEGLEDKLGPFIALGNPDDYLPAPGAAKIYSDHDNWRNVFSAIAAKAQVVIIVEGASEGLAWELSHIRSSLSPKKVFMVTQHSLARTFSWEITCRITKEAEIILPESDPGVGAVLAFDEAWIASRIASGVKEGKEYISAIIKQLNKSGLARDSILEVHNINTFYGMSQILFDVSLRVSKGEIVGIIGRNGSGKSTTMRSIAGLVAPRKGTITYKEHRVTGEKAYRLVRQGIAYVPDVRLVFADLTVEDNLEIAFRRNGTWTKDRVYQVFQSLAAIKNRRAGSLSSGEQQTLAIGRALMTSPELLLLDEPTEGLLPLEVRDREVQILKLRDSGLSILLAEQNVKPALNLISRAYVINNGRIRFEGSVADLKANEEVMRKYLMV